MNNNEKNIKKISIFILIGLVIILSVIFIWPVLLPAIEGLILAYIFMPLYKEISKIIKNRTLAATFITIIIIVGIFLIVWFLAPLLLQQVFELFLESQKIDVQGIISSIFPTSSNQFSAQMALTVKDLISKGASGTLNYFTNLLLDLPTILLDFFIVGFVFFFALRDSERLKSFVKGLSPIGEEKERIIINQFKDITDAVIYGQIVIGILQGILAGIGLLLFGVKGALVLTILAVIFSIIPILGPVFLYVPVTLYLFSTGETSLAVGYLIYNILIVSLIENILRSYIVSRKTNISPAVLVVGMLGGIVAIGTAGLIIGPLLIAYLITLLDSFKDKSIYNMFSDK